MKSLKSLLKLVGAFTLTASTVTTVVACNNVPAAIDLAPILTHTNLRKIYVINMEAPTIAEVITNLNRINNNKINVNGISISFKK